jgi:alpha-ketoglutarate-dependent taurine dioxygenase
VLNLLDPGIKKRFIQKKVMYVRNYGDGLGLSWQTVFQTTERKKVEEYCGHGDIEYEWKDGDRLRTRQVCAAVRTHGSTGEKVWFNQAHVHCLLSLEPSLRESLLEVAPDKNYPLDINAFYGDGSSIEASVLSEIKEVYRQATIVFPWQKGDILMLDNMLVAHGRLPYVAPRKILVAMAEPCMNGAE